MSIYDYSAKNIKGEDVKIGDFKGNVMLVVNTASKCGFTPQYEGLEKLYQQYREQGFTVLGFPCNQFLQQEPGDEAQIESFCQRNYGVEFPMFAKIDVNGDSTHPLYAYLKDAAPGAMGSKAIKWNFTKFLVGRDGKVFKRYAPTTKPEEMAADIERLLASGAA